MLILSRHPLYSSRANFPQLTQIPWLDWALRKNRVGDFFQRTFGTQASLGILKFVANVIEEKKTTLSSSEYKDYEDPSNKYGRGKDFLTRYVELTQSDPEIPPW